MADKKKCFVISPIGQPGDEAREHSDDVFDYIIKPAMEEVGMGVYRGDHDQKVGKITEHIFDSILNDDLCIVILSFQNPNVYYELAVAQCAARPVIILNLKGNPLPFDIKDLRVIEYTLRPRMIQEKTYVKQIVEMVQNIKALNWVVKVPFGNGLAPLGGNRSDFRVHERFENLGPSPFWLELFGKATGTIDISGITLRTFTGIVEFRDILKSRAAAGCLIRIMCLDSENLALSYYMNPKIHKQPGSEIVAAEQSRDYFQKLAAEQPGIQFQTMRIGCHHQQMFRVDGLMFSALVMFSEGTKRSPLIECRSPSPLFDILRIEFDSLWKANAEASPVDSSPH